MLKLPPVRNNGLPLRGYQSKLKADTFQAWEDGATDVCLVSPTGSGKCLAKDTPVMLASGRVTPVQDIKVGDLLMGPDSLPRRVVSLAHGFEEMYCVNPTKGDPYVVNASHILSVRHHKTGTILNVNVRNVPSGAKGWRVPGVMQGDLTPELTDISISAIGVGEYFGFELSGPDRLFLLGDFTVTHNTRTMGSIVHEFAQSNQPVMVSAHRQELVGQLSVAMASEGIYHNLIASRSTIRFISDLHMEKLGRSYYYASADVAVSSVPTLVRRDLGKFADQLALYTTDEAHHLVRDNQWGNARSKFKNARGLGVTATPERSDGKGLGRHADGFFDVLVEGLQPRELIRDGFLTDYRIFCPPSDLDLSMVGTTPSGDFNREQLRTASKKSHIVGDVVAHYLKIAPGKRGVTFVVSVEEAQEVCDAYNAAGVPARVLTGTDSDTDRVSTVRALESGEILQIVAIDVVSEGFDLPAIEVISMARPTQSYSLFIQQFGRALRPFPGKGAAIIIDHVGNVSRFIGLGRGLPDTPQNWTLDRREKRGKSTPAADVLKLTTCTECFAAYDSHLASCPWCGAVPAVGAARGGPERVEGDLYEMPAEMLAKLRGEIAKVDESPEQVRDRMLKAGAPAIVAMAAAKNIRARRAAQLGLRHLMSVWGGLMQSSGLDMRTSQISFYQTFGVDVLTAQTLSRSEADGLAARVAEWLNDAGVNI